MKSSQMTFEQRYKKIIIIKVANYRNPRGNKFQELKILVLKNYRLGMW